MKSIFLLLSVFTAANSYSYLINQGPLISKNQIIHRTLVQMIHIKGGTYMMGTNNKKFYDFTSDNMKPHKVTLTGFYFPKYLTMGTLYNSYLTLTNNKKDLKHAYDYGQINKMPAQDTWHAASGYCAWLNENTGLPFSLPTEAQWEYVARDLGKDIPYPTQNGKLEVGKNYPDDKTFNQIIKGITIEINNANMIPINALGIHQMGGNVNEWMKDWYASDYYWHSPVLNPQGPKSYPGTYAENVKEYNAPLKVTRGINSTTIELGMEYHHMKHDANSYARMFAPINSTIVGFRCVINSDKPMAELKTIAAKHLH